MAVLLSIGEFQEMQDELDERRADLLATERVGTLGEMKPINHDDILARFR